MRTILDAKNGKGTAKEVLSLRRIWTGKSSTDRLTDLIRTRQGSNLQPYDPKSQCSNEPGFVNERSPKIVLIRFRKHVEFPLLVAETDL